MANNFIARSKGLYFPGEYEPNFYQPEESVYTGELDNPDAYYNYAIEYTRGTNTDREVSDERNDMYQNRVKFNFLADVISGYGPRSEVRNRVPRTELYQETDFEKDHMRQDQNHFRDRLIEEAKTHYSKYENMTNVIEPPVRKDLVRYGWNNNPRMRGQVSVAALDNEYTYLQNHTVQNRSFNDKLLNSIMMDTHVMESKINVNHVGKGKMNFNPVGKTGKLSNKANNKITKSGVELRNDDQSMNLNIRNTKENFSSVNKRNHKSEPDNIPQYEDNENRRYRTVNEKYNRVTKKNNYDQKGIQVDGSEYSNTNSREKVMYNVKGTNKNAEIESTLGGDNRRGAGIAHNRKQTNNMIRTGNNKSGEGFTNYSGTEDYNPNYKRDNFNTNKYMSRNMVNNRETVLSHNEYSSKFDKKNQQSNMLVRGGFKSSLDINEEDNLIPKI